MRAYDITLKYTAQFLRENPPDDLQELLTQAQRAQLTLVTMAQTQRTPSDLHRKVRRDIARIKTVQREKG